MSDPAADEESTGDGPGVFSPGRLRAYRDLYGYTRVALGDRTGLPADTITAYEEGTATPPAAHLVTLAAALNVQPRDFTGPSGADNSWEYWGLICAAMPPMTADQIATVATVLRRIDKHRERPDDPPASERPRAA
ncbi:helix-turn-helix transcriptional regulator [Haloechinothrix salitolerans]|uniref:Helix-turn-helix domain-containing protein n=1 Tax=Haloechinothrix salitolerans TaxID=926830 RepID=A0ABW2C3V9_9PSEU